MERIPALLLLLTLPALVSAADPEKKEWISLFNGKDLAGWVPKITGYEAGTRSYFEKDEPSSCRY